MSDRIQNAQTTRDISSAEDLQHITDTAPDQSPSQPQTGVHPVAIEIPLPPPFGSSS
jgi:hypothetical protein